MRWIVGGLTVLPTALNAPSTARAATGAFHRSRAAARCIDSALVRRLLPLAIFLVLAAGCSTNKPGEKTVSPLPVTVVGTVPKAQEATVPAQYKNGEATAGKAVFESDGCKG